MKRYTLDDYFISRGGNIINRHNGKVLKLRLNNKGYGRVQIGGKDYFVHRLIAQEYVSNPENKPQVNHAVDMGLHPHGETCGYNKLTQEDVNFIREHSNMSINWLTNWANVSRSTIRDILSYKTWKPD